MNTKRYLFIGLLLVAPVLGSCLGARNVAPKNYFVLNQSIPLSPPKRSLKGLVRVRDLDADAVYEKFQFVVRRSPYELRYSDRNVWAVKPDSMLSDIIARSLAEARVFSGVTRHLGDTRPDYILGGKLHAIEVYDSGDLWYAHLAVSLRLTRFRDGEALMAFKFDERKHVPARTFSQAARALSELLADVISYGTAELRELGTRRGLPTVIRKDAPTDRVKRKRTSPTSQDKQPRLLWVPETETSTRSRGRRRRK